VSILGRSVGVTYSDDTAPADRLTASAKISGAASLINAAADVLTVPEKEAIGKISSIDVIGSKTEFLGAVGNGVARFSVAYLGQSSADWVGSLIGHEGQHYLNAGKFSGDNLWRDEQSAGRMQLGIGNKIGFTASESAYLENYTGDSNSAAMQSHMLNGYHY
jgi:hypothetical protein